MPEIRFEVQWPDGQREVCYSPSLIVQEYFEPGTRYDLNDFQDRARTALKIASDRVQAKYGRPCGLAIGQLQTIENRIATYHGLPEAQVQFLRFLT
ncbi:MAG: MSMEG_0570 family nitrogen starvation response protein [Prochlorothrix sp.]